MTDHVKLGMPMRRLSIQTLSASLSMLWLLSTGPAHADLYTAEVAYEKGDYATAFRQFKELAELGQPRAQYSLALLYAHAQGVPASFTYAHAWASLAGANGEADGTRLAQELEPELTPTSLSISSEIQNQFSHASLDKRLLPHFLKGKEYEDREAARSSKTVLPNYPPAARMRGVQGEVFVEFTVAPDGRARIPRILYAVPRGFFEDAVRESVMRSEYLPARINGQPVASSISRFYNFKMQMITLDGYGDLEKRVRETKAKAEAGDPAAQTRYGMMIAGLPQLKQTYDQALPWFLKAAQAGAPYAEYQVGIGLMRGHGCHCDVDKGEIWLQRAAEADQADAQVSLAEYLLAEKSSAESTAGAMVWLERAVKSGNGAGKLLLSAILASSPSDELRDAPRALKYTDELERDYGRDPSFWEIRAAANASRGDFKSAVQAQSKAIDEATRLGWNLTQLQTRQSSFSAGQSWTGDLLDFK
jgi:TonB family protein